MSGSPTMGVDKATVQSQERSEPSALRTFWVRFRRHPFGIVGAVVAFCVVVVAILAPVIAPHNPTVVWPNGLTPTGAPLPPDWQWNKFFLGTDSLGRDELSQLIWGSRVSVEVGVFATLIAMVVGTFFGALSGFVGGWLDNLMMRLTDVMLAFPFLLFVILLESLVTHPSIVTVFTAIGAAGWAPIARIARGQALTVRKLEYVEAARSIGATQVRILFRHVIPNILTPLVTIATLSIANNIILESALSYLGIGVPDPTPSWGKMIAQAQSLYQVDVWLLIFPGIAIILAVVSFNLIGDALNDALLGSRRSRR